MADEKDMNLEEEENDIVTLTDEDGQETNFEYLTTIAYEDSEYVVLMLIEEDKPEDDDEGEVVILKIEKDPETDEDIYVTVDDDSVSDAVFEKFMEMVNEDEEE